MATRSTPGSTATRRPAVPEPPVAGPPVAGPPVVGPPVVRSGALLRFDRVERAVHWANAALFAALILTGAVLYFGPLMALIGRRELIERIHVYIGLALPAPVILALAGRWGRDLRTDLRRFNRFTSADRAWLRAVADQRARRAEIRAGLRTGKFNAGQKLNAAFTGGAGLVMLGTGIILRWYRPWPLNWRAGATFVHNWLSLLIVVAIAGHILLALSDTEALRSMFRGTISRAWARRHAPAWLDELEAADGLPVDE
jgi:formate dehydrogenase gamma subunit